MNRREFLTRMAQAGLVLSVPKIVFDYGKNAKRYKIYKYSKTFGWYDTAEYEEIIIHGKEPMILISMTTSMLDLENLYNFMKKLPGAVALT